MTTKDELGKNGAFEVARLTAVGRGAVACVGVRGGDGWTAALERWRRSDGREGAAAFDDWSAVSAERPYFGFFRLDEIGGASEEIVLRRRTPTAFELCGHGGDVVASALVRFFAERGAEVVSADRWERDVEREEAFLAKMGKGGETVKLEKTGELGKRNETGKIDKVGKLNEPGEIGEIGELGELGGIDELGESGRSNKSGRLGESGERVGERWSRRVDELFFAGADALVVQTTTETTARIALAQRGAWRRRLNELKAELRAANRLSGANERRAAGLERAARLDDWAEKFELGRRLTEPFVVLLTGVPNAGKSSFLNAALGFERVVVSATSGTTRDLVGATTVVEGWPFRFVDAAGLRDASDPIERAGTRLTVEAAARADVALRFFDVSVGRAEQEAVFVRFFGDRGANFAGRTLDVLNKIDLPRNRWATDWRDFAEKMERERGNIGENEAVAGNWGSWDDWGIGEVSASEGAGGIKVNDAGSEERAIWAISARTGVGVDSLTKRIFAATVGSASRTAEPLLWRVDQVEFLREARDACLQGDFASALRIVEED